MFRFSFLLACLFVLQQMLLSCFRFDCCLFGWHHNLATQFQCVGAWKDDLLSRIKILFFLLVLSSVPRIWNANSRPNCRDLKIIVEIGKQISAASTEYLLLCFKEIFALCSPILSNCSRTTTMLSNCSNDATSTISSWQRHDDLHFFMAKTR